MGETHASCGDDIRLVFQRNHVAQMGKLRCASNRHNLTRRRSIFVLLRPTQDHQVQDVARVKGFLTKKQIHVKI